nr:MULTISPECIES: hypothetical protein [unclassified Rhizobium]
MKRSRHASFAIITVAVIAAGALLLEYTGLLGRCFPHGNPGEGG